MEQVGRAHRRAFGAGIPVRFHLDLMILAELAVEVAVWRRVQQPNPRCSRFDCCRVALSGLAPLV